MLVNSHNKFPLYLPKDLFLTFAEIEGPKSGKVMFLGQISTISTYKYCLVSADDCNGVRGSKYAIGVRMFIQWSINLLVILFGKGLSWGK